MTDLFPALLERRVGQPPGVEQRIGLHGIRRHHRVARPGGLELGEDGLRLVPRGGLGQVGAREEEGRRVVREAGALPLVHGLQAVAVDELELRGLQTAGRDTGDRGPAGGEGVEEPDDGARPRGTGGAQPDGHLGDHPERALRADHQPDQVVARHPLGRAPAQPQDLAGGGHDFEREHVVARDPVLDAAQTARIRGDVPADGRPRGARGIRRVPQAVLRGGGPQHVVHDTRLHDREPLLRIDLDDPAHPLGREHDPALDGVRATGQTRSGASRHDRHPVPGADRHRRRDLRGLQRPDDGQGTAVLGPLRLVVQVGGEDVGVGQDAVGGKRSAQLRHHRFRGCCHGSTVARSGRQEGSPVPV